MRCFLHNTNKFITPHKLITYMQSVLEFTYAKIHELFNPFQRYHNDSLALTLIKTTELCLLYTSERDI